MLNTNPLDFFIQWHLTENCNLSCRHCYQGERSADTISLPNFRKIVMEITDMISTWSDAYGVAFSRSMNITGGEPFLMGDFGAFLREVKKNNFDCYVLTNGTLITDDSSKMLADLGINGVQVSIDGPEDVHDSIRGKGSFALSAEGIERLVDAGVPVTLNVTLSRLNAPSVKQIIAFGSHIGASRIGFSRLVPAGKGQKLRSHVLHAAEVKEIYRSLFSLEIRALEIVTGDPIAAQMKNRSDGDAGNVAVCGCSAGVSGLTILPNGNVTPCRRLPVSLGNVQKDSLRDIWITSPVLGALRDRSRYKGKCGICVRWAHCRGCRAIAFAHSRSRGLEDYLADDPQCFFEVTQESDA